MRVYWLGLLCTLAFILACNTAPVRQSGISEKDRSEISMIPLPFSASLVSEKFILGSQLRVSVSGPENHRFNNMLRNFKALLSAQCDVSFGDSGKEIRIEFLQSAGAYPRLGLDESYELTIRSDKVLIKATTEYGISNALASLRQLLNTETDAYWPGIDMYDKPSYPWRGLMIDVCRHWIPKEVILKNIDAMHLVKLNVLHLHLTDNQAFRMESKRYPKLTGLSSRGNYYSQEDMKEIIEYAADRGIRIIPEFDVPGHASSWLAAYPNLGSGDGNYKLKDTYGVFEDAINPIKNETYTFLDELFGEMSQVFPDEYIHFGSDELLPTQWESNAEIQNFMQQNSIQDYKELQTFFNLKVQKILSDHGKKGIGWDEIIHPSLNKTDLVVQSWRIHESLFESAALGFKSILSSGWYLDHKLSAGQLYQVHPKENSNALTIEADSTQWKAYSLSFELNQQKHEGKLFLFGSDKAYRGMVNIMNRTNVFTSANQDGDRLSFGFKAPFGEIEFVAELKAMKISGFMNLASFSIPFHGAQIGGSDMKEGIQLPQFKKSDALSDSQLANILGGEVCIWTDWIDQNTILSRIWPSAAAVAERLWSDQKMTSDVPDYYRRHLAFNELLPKIGIGINDYRESLIKTWSGDSTYVQLKQFVDLLEEVKFYSRWTTDDSHNILKPLDHIADAAHSESLVSYLFSRNTELFLQDKSSVDLRDKIIIQLDSWIPLYRAIDDTIQSRDELKNIEVLALALSDLSKLAKVLVNGEKLTEPERNYYKSLRANATREESAVFLAPARALITLIDSYLLEL